MWTIQAEPILRRRRIAFNHNKPGHAPVQMDKLPDLIIGLHQLIRAYSPIGYTTIILLSFVFPSEQGANRTNISKFKC